MQAAEVQRVVLPDARLSVSKRFGRFKDEDEHAVRAPDVVEDKTLRQLREAWLSMRWDIETFSEVEYTRVLDALKGIHYSSADVEKFSVALVEFQNEDYFRLAAGMFLSALINNCKDNDFVINVRHLTEKIWRLGYQNTKNIIVSGDIGANLGLEMKCGTITVEGNADGLVGTDMEGGSIFVKGSVKHSVGAGMKNGKITVGGNVGPGLGDWMKGGEIHIHGTLEGLGDDIESGKIYHKGKLIYPRKVGTDAR
jgi:hypothetical protein